MCFSFFGAFRGITRFSGKREVAFFFRQNLIKACAVALMLVSVLRYRPAACARSITDANNAGLFLPTSIQSYLDGRVGQTENKMASLAYKQAVELDILSGIIADSFQFSEEDLRRRRAESVRNVKQTNGRISFEKRVRESWEDDDGWQD